MPCSPRPDFASWSSRTRRRSSAATRPAMLRYFESVWHLTVASPDRARPCPLSPLAQTLAGLPPPVQAVVASPRVRTVAWDRTRRVLGSYQPDHQVLTLCPDVFTDRVPGVWGSPAAVHTLTHEAFGHGLSTSGVWTLRGGWVPSLARTHAPDPATCPWLDAWVDALLGSLDPFPAVEALYRDHLAAAVPTPTWIADVVPGGACLQLESALAAWPRYADARHPRGLGLCSPSLLLHAFRPSGPQDRDRPLEARDGRRTGDALVPLVQRVRRPARGTGGPSPLASPTRLADVLARRRARATADELVAAWMRLDPAPSAYACTTPLETVAEHLTVDVLHPEHRACFPATAAWFAAVVPDLVARLGTDAAVDRTTAA